MFNKPSIYISCLNLIIVFYTTSIMSTIILFSYFPNLKRVTMDTMFYIHLCIFMWLIE